MTIPPSRLIAVVTTIQEPTACVRRLGEVLHSIGSELIVAGDKKGPAAFDLPQLPATTFLSLARQLELPYALAQLLPTAHYTRKNLTYLTAFERGATCVYETDDDNMPNGHWSPRALDVPATRVAGRPWFNVYRVFSDELIWPRGFPLRLVADASTYAHDADAPAESVRAPIQQGLADLAPDVDAVWRLILPKDFYFEQRGSVYLPPGTWCPFNSQTTWWWPATFPLMYLPSFCSFRMTDIWRSFIAQRCLWEMGHGLVFHAPEAIQERNQHNLIRDFADEISGYLKNEEIIQQLNETTLQPGPGEAGANLMRCYEKLVAGGIFPKEEIPLVKAWLSDWEKVGR